MTRHDIAAGLRLCRLSLWNRVEDDWRCFLDRAEGGGWLAEKDGGVDWLRCPKARVDRVACHQIIRTQSGGGQI